MAHRPSRRLLASVFLAILALNVLVCPPLGPGWLAELSWAVGT
jgi:hypothetical protein